MDLFNEKWNNSSIVTKIPVFAMALGALLLLICSILFFALSKYAPQEGKAYGVLWLIAFLYTALLSFGLLRINRIARVAVIIGGLCFLFLFILYAILSIVARIRIPFLKTYLILLDDMLINSVLPLVMSFVPKELKALVAFLLIVFIAMVMNILSMLILIFRGGDFKGYGGKKSKLAAYLLWFFLGFFSAHKFYLEKDGAGIVFFFTAQMFVFGWIIGLFTLGKQVDAYNAKLDSAPITSA